MVVHEEFLDSIFQVLTRSTNRFNGALIKKHTHQLHKYGEYSFPFKIEPWRQFVTFKSDVPQNIETIFEFAFPGLSLNDACEQLENSSKSMNLRIQRCTVINSRAYIFMDREFIMRTCLKNFPEILNLKYENLNAKVMMTVQENYANDLSSKRLDLLCDVFKNLVERNGYQLIDDPNSTEVCEKHIHFTKNSSNQQYKNADIITCAAVVNKDTGTKETNMSSTVYLKKKVFNIRQIMELKHGVKEDEAWEAHLKQLGEAAVTFNLMQIKPSHPVVISSEGDEWGCSKGVSFILYNMTRLSRILKIFNNYVNDGTYPVLPSIDEINVELLNDEDEWILAFNYLSSYLGIIKKCLEFNSDTCILSPHLLCTFLSTMARRISIYYRRIRVLLEPREHLIPLMHCRIRFVFVLYVVMEHGLSILNIFPITEM